MNARLPYHRFACMCFVKNNVASYFILSILSCVAPQFSGIAYAEEPIHVAVAAPMAGTSFSVGQQFEVGVKAAIQNFPDGKLLGREVQITTHDDNCSKEIAEKIAQSLAKDAPDVLIGHSCSSATIQAGPVYAQHNILQITPASSNPKVTEMGIDTLFRMIGRDDVQGRVAAVRVMEKYAGKLPVTK